MRKSISFCLALAVIVLMAACNKSQDGVYNPAKKIQKIYTMNDDGEKVLTEAWHWDGNTLASVDRYTGMLTNTDQFSYDLKNRLVRIENANSYTEISYDGNELDEIDMYGKVAPYTGELLAEYDFEYKNGKISKIEMESEMFENWDKAQMSNPLRFIVPEICPAVQQFVKENPSEAKSVKITMLLTWKGNNVETIGITMDDSFFPATVSETVECAFDKKSNPFYGLVSQMGSEITNNLFLNKNNMLNMTARVGAVTVTTMENTYEYDGDYPVKMVSKMTDDEGNVENQTVIYEY